MASHKEIENILQYQFQDARLLEEALTAADAAPSKPPNNVRKNGNKALALIGDALLRLVVVDDGIAEGATTAKCQKVCAAETSNNALYAIEMKWDFSRFIKTSSAQKGHVPRTTGASTMEALVGAVWIDSRRNFSRVHHVIHNLRIGVRFMHDNHTFESH
ncbi:ribonuclease III domain-containing protein [Hirsutella rhossiliensis]